jgi:uncharacterized Tic20 family protein
MSEVPHETPYDLPELTNDAKNWAMFCHLAGLFGFGLPLVGHVVGPLIIWALKRDEHPFIDHQGKEAINFQISMVIYMALVTPTLCIVIGFVLLPVLLVTDVVLIIIAAVAASRGEAYRYPLTIRLVK